MHELDLYGVLLPPLLVWAVAALAIRAVLRRALLRIGFYRYVAHPALFDIALLIILTGCVAALSTRVFQT